MSTKAKPQAKNLVEEEHKMDTEIARLEAERQELESPARIPTWEEIEAGAVEDLERRERRRGILPRLIVAAKVKRLELRRERYEREAEPLRKTREEAHERLQEAARKRLEAVEAENAARYEWTDALRRIESREQRIKETNWEIRVLRGEA